MSVSEGHIHEGYIHITPAQLAEALQNGTRVRPASSHDWGRAVDIAVPPRPADRALARPSCSFEINIDLPAAGPGSELLDSLLALFPRSDEDYMPDAMRWTPDLPESPH